MDGLVTVRDLHPRALPNSGIFAQSPPVSDQMFTANAYDTDELSFSSTIIRVSTVQFFRLVIALVGNEVRTLSFSLSHFLSVFSSLSHRRQRENERASLGRVSAFLHLINLEDICLPYYGVVLFSGNDRSRGTTSRESHLVRVEIKSDR